MLTTNQFGNCLCLASLFDMLFATYRKACRGLLLSLESIVVMLKIGNLFDDLIFHYCDVMNSQAVLWCTLNHRYML